VTNLLTAQQIAGYLGVPPSTIYKWTHEGFIPHVKLGRLVRFRLAEVERWVEKRSVAGRVTRRPAISI
jgi:excisionase family DNA binding protein